MTLDPLAEEALVRWGAAIKELVDEYAPAFMAARNLLQQHDITTMNLAGWTINLKPPFESDSNRFARLVIDEASEFIVNQKELQCPICNSTKLSGPLDYSEDGGDEDWWCDGDCVDYVGTPAGFKLKPRPETLTLVTTEEDPE